MIFSCFSITYSQYLHRLEDNNACTHSQVSKLVNFPTKLVLGDTKFLYPANSKKGRLTDKRKRFCVCITMDNSYL